MKSFRIDLPTARVVFTTRSGGCSKGAYRSLNLGLNTEDETADVQSNLGLVCRDLELNSLNMVKQVHGAEILELKRGQGSGSCEADGVATEEKDRAIGITGADCPAVFLISRGRLVGLHCGWRPVAAGLIERGAGTLAGEPFEAVIGPGICAKHFVVGEEVIEAMGADGESHRLAGGFDLVGLIRSRLRRAGARDVRAVDLCTYCEPDLFFSHRRDGGVTGRQAGVGWLI